MNAKEMFAKAKKLNAWQYTKKELYRGYTDKILYINVGENSIKEKDVPEQMKEKFVGGKGYGLRLLWDATTPTTKWDDPENEVIISSGPIGGITQYSGTGKSLLVSISPQTNSIMDSNVGGFFGPFLKFSGFDALELQGKAQKDVIIYIDGKNGNIEIFEDPGLAKDSHILAEELSEIFADDEKDYKNIGIVSMGAAAENSLIGMVNFTFYDPKRKKIRLKQAGRGGIGTVMRNKKIKAIVAKVEGVKGNLNNVADLEAITERGRKYQKEMRELDDHQCQMRKKGTANIANVMNDYDLLPTHNFKFGSSEDGLKIHSNVFRDNYFTQNIPDGCWIGCAMSCSKGVDDFILKTGPYKGQAVIVDGPEYETVAGLGSNLGIFNPEAIIEANFYCDTYGICTITWGTCMAFVMECYENGILNKEITGGLDLNFGQFENMMEVMHQLARGEGFGMIVGQGVRKMKEIFAKEYGGDPKFLQDIGMENKGLEYSQYVSKESLAQQGGYAMTNKGPQHDEAWLIFMDMVNNQIPTFEDKAEALHYFPMFRTWFGLQGLCKLPWNDVVPKGNAETAEPHKIPEHVDNYVAIYKGVTGKPFDKDEMIVQSERVYNFQRIFNIRRGFGLRKHDAQPYRAAGPVTREEYESRQERYDKQLKETIGLDPTSMNIDEKIAALRKYRENRYEQLLDAVYKRRGWNNNGVPTIEHLKKIKMDLPELIEVIKPLQ
ncbi:MAG TPA: aldehyde ferredoxin oxidoreductase C-terminal domain-containing protein [Tenuifilaceae bacterium]|nr:aldehyde ferredoxin oxidoreductase C-terminal domain-containing protein [Tenuifilaceae bacterium]HPE18198.1 aldehyde ferredoxin oxidoreductase C-terminal domain-containing protein [Tenuifilaceae bacterium]HPJ45481.1 aldehyde ferredoxin oxidoreductase C-terminal domain-containing protein [Tenuifilaceae bacterium]HPQ33888.1 aldehyde ferredoxin oxidoreductase C-terminal domain-containing protein [Tenuifilaceae bacterium]HRX68241.1 aldehyde ferredoxin oxidoreductase C-terminal domain-containing 